MHIDLAYILLSQQLQDYFKHYGYFGIYFWFISVDQIAPIPEEITLIVIGYFCSQGLINPVLSGVFSIAGFVTVDTVYFFLTKSGKKIFKKFTNKARHSSASGYKQKLKQHTLKTLIILCFIPRMRLLAPVFVSLMKFPYGRFVLYDVIGLVIFTTVYVSLGIIFHRSLSSLENEAKSLGNIIFIVAMVAMTIITIVIMRKMNKKSRAN